MRLPHRLIACIFFGLMIQGCGKKAGSDANPTPEPTATSGSSPSIEGTYLIVGSELGGKKSTDQDDSELDRTVKISKDQIQFKLFKREIVHYKLDPSKSPKEIDISSKEPGDKSKNNYGIYEVEGDTLTLFIVGAKEPQLRPREFKTLNPLKDGKPVKDADKQVGGYMILTLKKVNDDTTFISEPPPKPAPGTSQGGNKEKIKVEIAKSNLSINGTNVAIPADPVTFEKVLGKPSRTDDKGVYRRAEWMELGIYGLQEKNGEQKFIFITFSFDPFWSYSANAFSKPFDGEIVLEGQPIKKSTDPAELSKKITSLKKEMLLIWRITYDNKMSVSVNEGWKNTSNVQVEKLK